jgi:hypothetical protein
MQLLGAAREPECRKGLMALDGATFIWGPGGKFNNMYYWYYITQAKFHAGGDIWKSWNDTFAPVLVKNQIIEKDAIEDSQGRLQDIGHWAPEKELSGHTDSEGRVMNTCLSALQLQVYYRYLPTFKKPKELELDDEEAIVEEDVEIEITI